MQRLEQEVHRLQHRVPCSEGQQTGAAAADKTRRGAASSPEPGEQQAEQGAGRQTGTPPEQPAAGTVAALQAQIDRLEFERTELQVKLDQSEQQVASLAAAAQQSTAATPGTPSVLAQEQGSDAAAAAIVDSLQRQLQERNREVEELSALGVQADGTVQQYMAQLRAMAAELQVAGARHEDTEAGLARATEEVQVSFSVAVHAVCTAAELASHGPPGQSAAAVSLCSLPALFAAP